MPILTPEERLGQVVGGRYRLDALLSIGGMGVLFRAFDCQRETPAAVKMLKPTHVLEADRVARFVRETRIAQQISHPHIARTLDAFSDESGVPFLVMELLEGHTLAHELDERSVLPLDEALAIVLPIVHALEATHALGVIHRDLKPSNIFLCRGADGRVAPKLIDFGIAKGPQDGFETETGMLLGTPGYMAPEQVQYAECSAFTDVWGIGAVLYRCLAGHPPHAAETPSELLQKLLREPVPPLARPDLNRQLCATIDRALARDPHRRYPSMQAFGRALAAFTPARGEAVTGAQRVRSAPDRAAPNAKSARKFGRAPQVVLGFSCILAVTAFASAGTDTAVRPSPLGASALAQTQPRAAFAPPQHVQAALVTPALSASPLDLAARSPIAPDGTRRSRSAEPRPRAQTNSARSRTGAAEPAARGRAHAVAVEREATTGLPVATEW